MRANRQTDNVAGVASKSQMGDRGPRDGEQEANSWVVIRQLAESKQSRSATCDIHMAQQ